MADASTGTAVTAHPASAAGSHQRRSGRSLPTILSVNSGLASNRAIAKIITTRGVPTNRRTRPTTNSIATDANIHMTARNSSSGCRRYRHDTQESSNANSDVTRINAMGTSSRQPDHPGNKGIPL
ncbi:hypothetical protein [Paractinoplanes rishiriensis]|uniref:hypothetical protein n=1 Tax=Paractinoplanes rishiriensis TaxID=1050105 RepID=UPI001942BA96|nr:hypothetical protein [Actinoplanes rishiriensis]